jgi:ubiquinone/menaquinone biosynthesis C-methylase UbiE
MFTHSAQYYDAIYLDQGKDYKVEAGKVDALIEQYKQASGNSLLDVACGTGTHLGYLCDKYLVEGLDLDEKMLAVAREKLPGIPFHHASMFDFKLEHAFDAITCLFGSIGYVKTLPNLERSVANMNRHLKPGGVLIVEPWITPENWTPGKTYAQLVDQPELKIARMSISGRQERLSTVDFQYLVATPEGIEHFTERHELGLFTHEEYLSAFRKAGLETIHDPVGFNGRGLYIGIKGIS